MLKFLSNFTLKKGVVTIFLSNTMLFFVETSFITLYPLGGIFSTNTLFPSIFTVEEFENEMCDFLEIPRGHAIAVSSGSSAISLALQTLNEKRKIEKVYYPAYSCVAVENAAKSMGVDVEALDCDYKSPNINIDNKTNIIKRNNNVKK